MATAEVVMLDTVKISEVAMLDIAVFSDEETPRFEACSTEEVPVALSASEEDSAPPPPQATKNKGTAKIIDNAFIFFSLLIKLMRYSVLINIIISSDKYRR